MKRSREGRRRPPGVRAVIALAFGLAALAPAAGAADFTVNTSSDADDGSCDPPPGSCTLREAIAAVNAGLGASIDFDPASFPPGMLTSIAVGSALPAILGSGTSVDGSGAGVVIDGLLLLGAGDGLAFESGAGSALAKVTVRALGVRNFPGDGISVCGGARPDCSDPLSRVQVSQVTATTNGGAGIRIDGGVTVRASVTHSYAAANSGRGILINAETNLERASVSASAAVFNGGRGVELNAANDNVSAQLAGNVASANFSTGLHVNAGDRTVRPRIVDNTATGSDGRGIHVNAGNDLERPQITGNHASKNGAAGIDVNSGEDFLGGLLADNVAAGNAGDGLFLNSSTSLVKATLRSNRAVANGGRGIRLEGSRHRVEDNESSDNDDDGIRLEGPGEGSKLRGNRARANLGAGVRLLAGSTAARIQGNAARGNGTDLVDENPGCDANVWRGNAFVTRNEDCIE